MTSLVCYNDVLNSYNALIYEDHVRMTVTVEEQLLMHNEAAKENPETQYYVKTSW